MTVGHEDIAVRRDDNVGWAIEGVGPCAQHSWLAERQQDLAVRIELDHLVPFAWCRRGAVVSDPDVALAIDVHAVRDGKQSRSERLHQTALCVKLENRRDRRVGARVAAAAICEPYRGTVAVDVHSADSAEGATLRQLWPVPDERIWIGTIIHRRSVLCGATQGDEQHGADDRQHRNPVHHGAPHCSNAGRRADDADG